MTRTGNECTKMVAKEMYHGIPCRKENICQIEDYILKSNTRHKRRQSRLGGSCASGYCTVLLAFLDNTSQGLHRATPVFWQYKIWYLSYIFEGNIIE